jgi:hypothetical protein
MYIVLWATLVADIVISATFVSNRPLQVQAHSQGKLALVWPEKSSKLVRI